MSERFRSTETEYTLELIPQKNSSLNERINYAIQT